MYCIGEKNLSDVCVDEDVDCPRVAELLVEGSILQYVHVESERDVLDHDEIVGQGQSGQDSVRRRDLLIHPSQDDDIQGVCNEAKEADHKSDVAMHESVVLAERFQIAVHLTGHICWSDAV